MCGEQRRKLCWQHKCEEYQAFKHESHARLPNTSCTIPYHEEHAEEKAEMEDTDVQCKHHAGTRLCVCVYVCVCM